MFEERTKRILRKSLMAISDVVVVNHFNLEREICAKLSSTLVSHFFCPVGNAAIPSAREVESITLPTDCRDSIFDCDGMTLTEEAGHRLVAFDFAKIANQSFDV